MNSERNILSRLLEGNVSAEMTELDERTYTVGDTQYWKRAGKFYSWTAAGGRKECSEEDYMKAISGGSGDSPKHTEPSNDAAKKPEPSKSSDPKLGDAVDWKGETYTIIRQSDNGMMTLRPTDKIDDYEEAYEGGGDSYYDFHIDKYQLTGQRKPEPPKPASPKKPEADSKPKTSKDNPAVIDSDKPFTNAEIMKVLGVSEMDWELEPAGYGNGYKDYKVTSGGETHFIRRMTPTKTVSRKKPTPAAKKSDPEPKMPEGMRAVQTPSGEFYRVSSPSGSDWIQVNPTGDGKYELAVIDRNNLAGSYKKQGLTKADAFKMAKDVMDKGHSTSSSSKIPSAKEDYFGTANPYRVGRSGDFEKDMKFIQGREPGVTAQIAYGDKTIEYARKVADNKWMTDSGKTLSDNDVASVAYDDGKVILNYMIKHKPEEPKPEPKKPDPKPEPTPIEQRRNAFYDDSESDYVSYDGVRDFDHTTWIVGDEEAIIKRNPSGRGYYLQTDEYDEDFDTKGDLVHFLRSRGAEFQGQDSEHDY